MFDTLSIDFEVSEFQSDHSLEMEIESMALVSGNNTQPKQSEDSKLSKHTFNQEMTVSKFFIIVIISALAITIGFALTTPLMIFGETIAHDSSIKILALGGVIWNVFGPLLPFLLLAHSTSLAAKLLRFRNYTVTLIPACLVGGIAIIPLLYLVPYWANRFNSAGLQKNPLEWTIGYEIVGMFYVIFRVARDAELVSERNLAKMDSSTT